MQDEEAITLKFRAKIPLALQTACPSTAALHAARVRLLGVPGPATEIFSGTHCNKCGHYLLDGTGSIRTVRKPLSRRDKKRASGLPPYARTLRRTCSICSNEEEVPFPKSDPLARRNKPEPQHPIPCAPLIDRSSLSPHPTQKNAPPNTQESIKALAARSSSVSAPPPASPAPARPTHPASTPSTQSSRSTTPIQPTSSLDGRAKSRTKKKSGLQDMLARNRERQEQEKKAKTGSGLAAFLEGL